MLSFDTDVSLIRYYADILRRRIWVIATVFVVFLTVGAVRAFRAVPVYQSVAKVVVETQTSRAVRFEGALEDGYEWDPEYYQTQVELVQSQAVLEKVLDQKEIRTYLESPEGRAVDESTFHDVRESLLALLGASPGQSPERWERLRGLVRAKHLDDTRFILISAECGSPHVAALLANATARSFQQYYLEKKETANQDAFGFLSGEIREQESKLTRAGEALQQFREKSGNVSFSDAKQDQPVIERLDRLNKEFTDAQLGRIDLEAQRAVVENLLRQSATGELSSVETIVSIPFVRDDPAVTEKMERLTTAEKQVVNLSNTYGPEHPQLVAARADVERLSRELDEVLRATVASIGNRLETLKGKESDLQAQIDGLRQEALLVAKDAFEFGRLENEVERHRKIYDALVQRFMEIDVSSGFMKTNVEIVEPAAPPKAPIRPNRGRMTVMAGFLGLFLGVAIGLFFEHLDDTVKTPEDLRSKLGVPLIGFVPVAVGETNKKEPPPGFGMITAVDPMTSVAEAYRSIRTSLFYSIPAGHTKTLVLTSCGPGEGKTSTSTNLAVAMAMSGKRTLLIDADLHRPAVHHVFSIERKVGLTSVLVGDSTLSAAAVQVPFKDGSLGNLRVLTAGPDTPNPSELLGSAAMAALLKEAAGAYDWVLVDTPPVFFVSDTSVLSALVDGVVLVVRVGVNNRSRLNRVREHLEHIHVRIIGAVLNRVVVSRIGRYYSDYYYHGYSRYAKDYHKSYYSVSRRHEGTKPGAQPAKAGVARVPVAPAEPKQPATAPSTAAMPEPTGMPTKDRDDAVVAGQANSAANVTGKQEDGTLRNRLDELKASHERFEDRLQTLMKRIGKNDKA